jgi:hypothetical protein
MILTRGFANTIARTPRIVFISPLSQIKLPPKVNSPEKVTEVTTFARKFESPVIRVIPAIMNMSSMIYFLSITANMDGKNKQLSSGLEIN